MAEHFEHDSRFDDFDRLDDWKLVHSEQDLRGRELYDELGVVIGTIEDMMVDQKAERVVAFRLEDGRMGSVERLVIGNEKVVYHNRTPDRAVTYYDARRG